MTQPIRTIITKQFEIKGANLSENQVSGAAAVTGNLDRAHDVIFPGAFKGVLKDFLANGFVAVGHSWTNLPVAMPISAKEVGNQLQTVAEFHTHQAAQDARTVARERIAKNLSVGLSVGFRMDYDTDNPSYIWFENGTKLLEFAKANGYDMTLFDSKTIKACKGMVCGIIQISELLEYSIVPVPCNTDATVMDAKAYGEDLSNIKSVRDYEEFLRDAGFSRKNAVALASHGFKSLQRDADENESQDDQPAQIAEEMVHKALSRARELRASIALGEYA